MLDFAGGTVVHINAGVAGLVACLVIGKRSGYGVEEHGAAQSILSLIGASLLWVGWFGFNAGSAVAAGGRAGMAMAVTQIATATAALTWMFIEWLLRGKPSVLGIVSRAVGGLVAITPASGFVGPLGGLFIGIGAGAAAGRARFGQAGARVRDCSTSSVCMASVGSSAPSSPASSPSKQWAGFPV